MSDQTVTSSSSASLASLKDISAEPITDVTLSAAPVKEAFAQEEILHPHDIISGRGNETQAFNHPGNIFFRELVKKHKFKYVASAKRDKPAFAKAIIHAIMNKSPPGRFMKQDKQTGAWYDIGSKQALMKTRQALREGAPMIGQKLKYVKKIINRQKEEEAQQHAISVLQAAVWAKQQEHELLVNAIPKAIESSALLENASFVRATSRISPSITQQITPQNLFNSSQMQQTISNPFLFGINNHQQEYETSSARMQPAIHSPYDNHTGNLHPMAIKSEHADCNAPRLLNGSMANQLLLAQQTMPPQSGATAPQDTVATRALQLLQQQQLKDHRRVDQLTSKAMHLLLQQQQIEDKLRVDQAFSFQQIKEHANPLASNTAYAMGALLQLKDNRSPF
eukprot:451042_1